MSKLTRQTDAFGLALHDQLAGRCHGAVIERDDGLVEPLSDIGSYFAPLRAWPARQRRAMRLARCPSHRAGRTHLHRRHREGTLSRHPSTEPRHGRQDLSG